MSFFDSTGKASKPFLLHAATPRFPAKRPDLALEVVHTHGGLDKLDLYAKLGVREVWFWIGGKLTVHVLRSGRYVRAARSQLFKSLDLSLLVRFAKHSSQARAKPLYRAALKAR